MPSDDRVEAMCFELRKRTFIKPSFTNKTGLRSHQSDPLFPS